MMKEKILIILGHSNMKSLCAALAESYAKGARESGAKVEELHLVDLKFDPFLYKGYDREQSLEPDLQRAQELIKWADHLVFVYPTWWGTMPALLKGFIDRVFLPGFAFKYRENSPWWDKYLTGRSGHLIVTMNAPTWYYTLVYGRPGHKAMKKMTLEFCGIKPVRITSLGSVKSSAPEKITRWIAQASEWGKNRL